MNRPLFQFGKSKPSPFAYLVTQDPVSKWWLLVRFRRERSNAPRALLIGEYETQERAAAINIAASMLLSFFRE